MKGYDRAVFLDRDGVLIEDSDLLTDPEAIRILPGVPAALARLRAAGFRLVVVSNQSVVARGLATEAGVRAVNARMDALLQSGGAPSLDGIYFCPHHPNATVPAYRLNCDCRKPKPGLIVRASTENRLDPAASFLVGDRLTDVLAGARAGCRTVLVQTGRHLDAPIVTAEPLESAVEPDCTCAGLADATRWILEVA